MFHAMLFTGFSEDGSSPLPALNLWPRATERFQSSMSDYPWGVPSGCVIYSTMGGVRGPVILV